LFIPFLKKIRKRFIKHSYSNNHNKIFTQGYVQQYFDTAQHIFLAQSKKAFFSEIHKTI